MVINYINRQSASSSAAESEALITNSMRGDSHAMLPNWVDWQTSNHAGATSSILSVAERLGSDTLASHHWIAPEDRDRAVVRKPTDRPEKRAVRRVWEQHKLDGLPWPLCGLDSSIDELANSVDEIWNRS